MLDGLGPFDPGSNPGGPTTFSSSLCKRCRTAEIRLQNLATSELIEASRLVAWPIKDWPRIRTLNLISDSSNIKS